MELGFGGYLHALSVDSDGFAELVEGLDESGRWRYGAGSRGPSLEQPDYRPASAPFASLVSTHVLTASKAAPELAPGQWAIALAVLGLAACGLDVCVNWLRGGLT